MLALIDGDIIVYRAGFAAEKKNWILYHGEGPEMVPFESKTDLNKFVKDNEITEFACDSQLVVQDVSFAVNNLITVLDAVKKQLNPDKMRVFISGKDNYRYKIATVKPYKGNRDDAHKPAHYEALRNYLIKYHKCWVSDNEEADDTIGIAATECASRGVPCVVVSTDKDLDMIPGAHFNWVKGLEYSITPEEAMMNFYLQLLSGDATDNVPGVPGIGIAKAQKLLSALAGGPEEELYTHVWATYKDHFPDLTDEQVDAMVLEMGRLLWIRRYPEELWNPPV